MWWVFVPSVTEGKKLLRVVIDVRGEPIEYPGMHAAQTAADKIDGAYVRLVYR